MSALSPGRAGRVVAVMRRDVGFDEGHRALSMMAHQGRRLDFGAAICSMMLVVVTGARRSAGSQACAWFCTSFNASHPAPSGRWSEQSAHPSGVERTFGRVGLSATQIGRRDGDGAGVALRR
jgi:hypothetical protein